MTTIFRILLIILFMVMSAGFLSTLKADAEEGTCIFEASNQDVFVIVWDQDDEGNTGHLEILKYSPRQESKIRRFRNGILNFENWAN